VIILITFPDQPLSKPAAVSQLAWRSCVICLLLVVLLWAPPHCAAAERDDGMPKLFRSGFLQSVFSNIDPRDAKAVMEVHGRKIAEELKINITDRVIMFPTLKTMVDAIRKGELELVSIPSSEYLRIRKTVPLLPSFVGTNGTSHGNNFVVITRRDSGIHSFSNLRGKSIMLPPASIYEPGHLWLDVLLLRAGKGGRDTFFSQVMESPKITKAVMGVFFRQVDAAIVTRSGLEISRQLNPQLETQLTVLAESPNLSDFVVCMNPTTSENFRNKLSNALIRLNESKSGQQLYIIFQTKGIIPFKPEYLEGLEGLHLEHDRLAAKKAKRI